MHPTTGFEWTGGCGGIGKHSGGDYQARPKAKKLISKLGYEDNDISVEVQRVSARPVRPAAKRHLVSRRPATPAGGRSFVTSRDRHRRRRTFDDGG